LIIFVLPDVLVNERKAKHIFNFLHIDWFRYLPWQSCIKVLA